MEIGTQDLYSLRIALNQLSYTKNLRERERERERGGGALGCVLALRRLFFTYKTKTQNPTRTYKENELYSLKLALAGN